MQHAREALEHAEMAQQKTKSPHLDDGIMGREAIKEAQNG